MSRVVITGIGLVTPIGIGKNEFWKNVLDGKSGIAPIRSFDTSSFDVHLGAEIRDFDPHTYLDASETENMGKCSQLAVAAASLALQDAGLNPKIPEEKRVGVVLGTTMGESQVLEEINRVWVAHGIGRIPPQLAPRYPCYTIPSHIARKFGFRGPNLMIPTACSAGNYAIGYATDLLRENRADLMLAGGADCISRIAYTGFARVAAIAPEQCQPFDKNRKGMMVGEGACVLVLESLPNALSRNADVYAEILGYGLGCDAYHMTGSHPEGLGMVRAMEKAFRQSGVAADRVDYISAHGTGTPTNDRVESLAMKRVFGSRLSRIPASSIKSMIGHTMGAASAIEAATCALSIRNHAVPPTINYTEKDPECDLDCVPNTARDHRVDIALNNSAAFGGLNASLVLGSIRQVRQS